MKTEKGSHQEENVDHKDGPLGMDYDAEDVFAGAEPWNSVETKLVLGSFAAALFFLVIFGVLINLYILK
ncbi:MAG: hypothetical protein SV775_09220 [Thermodesulfobacteriota bacterium]|nr:hypothetical protein [Thermodesulfobacteriota bacterium]